jgi:predicted O-methyltransferase YrrM
VEIGTFIGYTGLFMLLTAMSLAKYPIIPKNHPYLEESIHLHEE